MATNFKETLMTALNNAVQYFNETNDPNKAVIKAAQEFNFNPHQATRLVEVFNTARTICHYKSASDRTVPFSLADVSVVIPALFSDDNMDNVSLDKESNFYDYSFYDNDEKDYDSASDSLKITVDEPGYSLDTLAKAAMDEIKSYRNLAAQAKDEANLCHMKVEQLLQKLASKLTSGDQLDVLNDRYNRFMRVYGDNEEYKDLIKQAHVYFPANVSFCPSDQINRLKAINISDLQEHVALLDEAKKFLKHAHELEQSSSEMLKRANNYESEFYSALGIKEIKQNKSGISELINFDLIGVKLASNKPQADDSSDNLPKPQNKEPKLPKALVSTVEDAIGAPLQRSFLLDVERALGNADIKTQKRIKNVLANVRSEMMLQDLLLNDEVLSEVPPDKVVSAYISFKQLAPSLSLNKEVVRSFLRQAVHSSSVSPFDAEILAKVERSLRDINPANQQSS